MLNPDARSLYTSAVCPPPGYVFDQAIATTYSLDPATLLSLPTHLSFAERPKASPPDPIKLLESLRRLSDRFSIYVDHTGIKVPSLQNPLYGMLESMAIPVKAPRGGVFHPKIWVLRFVQPDLNEPPLIRLLVLSRNITYDRSWDVSLQLEGRPGWRINTGNQPLVELLQALPSLSTRSVPETQQRHAAGLAEEIRKTIWEFPEGFESVSFHVLGHKRRVWEPSRSNRMAVISPFLTERALEWLGSFTEEFVAVVSRPDELKSLPPAAFENASLWYTLDEAAESEDGEVTEARDSLGLHAKLYVMEKGWDTSLVLGSANATSAALREIVNVEILAELTGKKSRVGGIDRLLGDDGLGHFLCPYVRAEEDNTKEDAEETAARKALEAARSCLAEAGLKILCRAEGDTWRLWLSAPQAVHLPGISCFRAWPITVSGDRAVDAFALADGRDADMGKYATESVTGLIAFSMATDKRNLTLEMVLNLPVEGLPENRDEAIFRLVVNNWDGFLRYLLLLLGEPEDSFVGAGGIFNGGDGAAPWRLRFSGDTPILEELARAFSRNPDKLKEVRAVVERLMKNPETASIIPPDFTKVWMVFEEALREAGR